MRRSFIQILGEDVTFYKAVFCTGIQLLKDPLIFSIAAPYLKTSVLWRVMQSNIKYPLFTRLVPPFRVDLSTVLLRLTFCSSPL